MTWTCLESCRPGPTREDGKELAAATCEQEARALLVKASGLKADSPQGTELGEPLFVSAKNADAGVEPPSTVVDCTGERLKILRVGAITAEAIEAMG